VSENRDWYLLPLVFNTLSLLFIHRLLKSIIFLKLLLRTGLYNLFQYVDFIILAVMVSISIIYIAMRMSNKVRCYMDFPMLILSVLSLFNLITYILLYQFLGE